MYQRNTQRLQRPLFSDRDVLPEKLRYSWKNHGLGRSAATSLHALTRSRSRCSIQTNISTEHSDQHSDGPGLAQVGVRWERHGRPLKPA